MTFRSFITENQTELPELPRTIGELVKLSDITYVLSRKHKDIEKGTITRSDDHYDIKTSQPQGKKFQFMVRYSKTLGKIIIGARSTNGVGSALILKTEKGGPEDLEKIAKKYSTIKVINKTIKDNLKNIKTV